MAFDIIIGRNESDKKKFQKRGLAYIGKSFVTMGNYTSLSNPIYLDIAGAMLFYSLVKEVVVKVILLELLLKLYLIWE